MINMNSAVAAGSYTRRKNWRETDWCGVFDMLPLNMHVNVVDDKQLL